MELMSKVAFSHILFDMVVFKRSTPGSEVQYLVMDDLLAPHTL